MTVPQGLKTLVEECWAPDFEARPDFHVVSKVDTLLNVYGANQRPCALAVMRGA